ncbi:ABC transporter substrate-binding protein [Streptomyces sp. NPDC046203]|uniref:ABC transporter family substrate-binding protein n=1 Tax=Streptomyces sp. NPDC046203 TaxID=3154602 RepID=UPI0033D27C82
MAQVGVPRGRTGFRSPRSRTLRSVATLGSAVLTLSVLAGCSSGGEGDDQPTAAQDDAPAARDKITDGGSLRWAVDAVPTTLNTFQADADGATARIAGAVLPALHTLDERGRPKLNPDYLESAEIVESEPRQVVLYKLHQQAVWSNGREIGAPDFVAQWRALSGRNTAYWTARNAGYDRIEKIERGKSDLEVRVTFAKPYADWRALFTPLYPKEVMGSPDSFNDGARTALKATAGPFMLKSVDRDSGHVTLARNPRWWGRTAKLDSIVLTAVPRAERAAALAAGKLDLADVDRSAAERIALAVRDARSGHAGTKALTHGPGAGITPAAALKSWALAYGSDEEKAAEAQAAREQNQEAVERYAREQKGLGRFVVRKSLEPAYTQLSLNGETGPLSDERVRRAVARALDRKELAEVVLRPLGLPAQPLGSHLALAGQAAYVDSSDALGAQDTKEAQALLADAGWVPGGALKKPQAKTKAGSEAAKPDATGEDGEKTEKAEKAEQTGEKKKSDDKTARGAAKRGAADDDVPTNDGLYIVGEDDKPGDRRPAAVLVGGRPARPADVLAPALAAGTAFQSAALLRQAEALDLVIDRESDAEPESRTRAGSDGTRTRADSHAGTRPVSQDKGGAQAQTEPRTEPQAGAHPAHPVAGAYAPRGTAAPAPAAVDGANQALGKDGKPLSLRFVLPSGPGSESLRAVGDRIVRMLDAVGIRTEVTKVPDDSFFKDHIASGDYDLALYSWPATAYPATDARPIYAKPEPASDGSLIVEQNYARVGTDRIDQLFDQAAATLDEDEARDLVRQADARIWAAAGSIPLYQRPQLVAAKPDIVNAGAWGFAAPRYQDIGYKKPGSSGPGKESGETKGNNENRETGKNRGTGENKETNERR